MQVYNEEDYLLLSGLQHFNFCRRQWALIHIEQQWEENVRTIEGNHLHRKADQPMIREKEGISSSYARYLYIPESLELRESATW